MSDSAEKNHQRLGRDSMVGLLTRLSIPSVIGMLSLATYNLVDAIFVGRYVGPLGLAGLTVTFPIQMIIIGLGVMLGIGGASVVSRALGAGTHERAEQCLGNLVSFCIVGGLVMIVPALVFHRQLLDLFGATEKVLPYAAAYMRITVAAGIVPILGVMLNNQVRAQGDATKSMLIMLTGSFSNVLLDFLFVPVFGWGVTGAATATVLGQAVMTLVLLHYFTFGKSYLKLRFRNLRINLPLIGEAVAVGFPTLAQQAGGSLMMIFANRTMRYYDGAAALAVFGIINRVLMFMFMPLIGIVQGLRPIMAYNYGAEYFKRTRHAAMLGIGVLSAFSFAFFIIIQLFAESIFKIFSTDPDVLRLGAVAIRIMVIGIPTIGFQIVVGSFFQAIGRPGPALTISMGRQFLFLIPLLLILPNFMQLNGVWTSFPIADLLGAGIALTLVIREMKKINKCTELE